MTPVETENPMGGYGKTVAHVIIGLKTAKGGITNGIHVMCITWSNRVCKAKRSLTSFLSSRNETVEARPQYLRIVAEGESGSGRRHLHRSQFRRSQETRAQ